MLSGAGGVGPKSSNNKQGQQGYYNLQETLLAQLHDQLQQQQQLQHRSSKIHSPSLIATGVSHSLPRTYKSSFSPLRHGRKRLRRSNSVTDLTHVTSSTSHHQQQQQQQHHSNYSSQQGTTNKRATLLSQKSLQFDDPIASNHEIERIIAKIQQDNKILAELDKNAGESIHTP